MQIASARSSRFCYGTPVAAGLRTRVQPLPASVLFGSIVFHGSVVVRYFCERAAGDTSLAVVTFTTVLVLSASLSLIKYLLIYRWQYAIALAFHFILAVPVMSLLRAYDYAPVAWAFIFILEIAVYMPLAWSLLLGGLVTSFYALTAMVWSRASYQSADAVWTLVLELCGLLFVTLGAGLLINYRERLVWSERERDRLDESLTRLAAANMSYQAYAIDLEERSVEKERQRITRDIHDIVGYTLTNNIIMMEAAVDMIRKDPLGVPRLLHSARQNSEHGLEQIRTALYQLRAQSERAPEGVGAITRMVRVFQRATGVEVRLELGGEPFRLSGDANAAVLHFVQEGLINSFRHGRATQILVMFYLGPADLSVNVWDNGAGSDVPQEGIGISGMRERAEQMDGSLTYENAVDGFSITLRIPRSRL